MEELRGVSGSSQCGGSGGGSGSSQCGGSREAPVPPGRRGSVEAPVPPVKETNKLRAQLGLKPLDTSPARKEAGTEEEPRCSNPLGWGSAGRSVRRGQGGTAASQKVGKVKTPGEEEPSLDEAAACPHVPSAIHDRYSRCEESRAFTQDFKEKDGYWPRVKIEYVDETGRRLTPREAFRQLSHRFNGKGSGRMKTERRMKKLDEEALLKKMSSSGPLGMVALLQEKPAQKMPYIVLSGSSKSMNANAITK
ncbi:LOW QUALITY PROTEIN: U4/U6.U5 tri-snRNP-associated protein 1 [Geothlypis trichas]